MKKQRSPKVRKGPQKEKSLFVCVFIGTLIALLIGLSLLAISTLAALSLEDPEYFIPVFALAALFVTALLGGYIAALTHRENGLFCGVLSGILLIAILVLLCFAFSFSIHPTLFFICSPAILVVSAIAGVCAVSTKRERRTHHKKKF